ncbi:hypothetical protein [Mucilaginibacter sp. SP1R1]|uniref:hypothetical protein n=1 Tax=Mucilaginibacter sp. SP1R1 TaxID=2723091 RepID=UPI0016103CD7|nr:hypothetical protein [Mucilaginibacter sp. SP1R1]MBB6149457.1 hypothetical protein [Mucilaginibacter sp. SP1R1]
MQVLNNDIKKYLDDMQPGVVIKIWEQRYPVILIHAAKEYINNGGALEFSNDYEQLKKL